MEQHPFFLGVGPTTSLTSENRWKLCDDGCCCGDSDDAGCGGIIWGGCGERSGWCCKVRISVKLEGLYSIPRGEI